MKASKAALIGLALSVPALGAAGTGLPLTEPERQAFRTELRAALLADPSPIEAALNPPPIDLYADDKAAGLALIEAHGAALFSTWPAPNRIAFLTKESCDDCIKAEAELVEIRKTLAGKSSPILPMARSPKGSPCQTRPSTCSPTCSCAAGCPRPCSIAT